MESELRGINVTLSNDQKQEIINAFINSKKIRLRLTKDALKGLDTLLVPTRFFEEMDNEDGIDACVDKQTKKEMQDQMRKELKFFIKEMLKVKSHKKFELYFEWFFKRAINEGEFFLRNVDVSDEMLEDMIHEEVWEYYGLFFNPAIDESMENKGIEFNLDYSLLNDLAKDLVKDNIKKLIL